MDFSVKISFSPWNRTKNRIIQRIGAPKSFDTPKKTSSIRWTKYFHPKILRIWFLALFFLRSQTLIQSFEGKIWHFPFECGFFSFVATKFIEIFWEVVIYWCLPLPPKYVKVAIKLSLNDFGIAKIFPKEKIKVEIS